MKTLVAVAMVGVSCWLIAGSPAVAQQQRILLTPEQTKIYHACLTAAWLQEYCNSHAWGIFATFDRTKIECVAADRGDIYSLSGRGYFENTEGYCWNQAHEFAR
jgi:hypothetical protein